LGRGLLERSVVLALALAVLSPALGSQPAGADTDEDRRALTPLIWLHVLLYGEVKLNMKTRFDLGKAIPPA
jgi:hypothetical protein